MTLDIGKSIRKLVQDDDSAVSPVIGVILMVAITVILAAVIATFVLGLGEQVSDSAPQANFGFEFDSGDNPDSNGDSFQTGGTSGADGNLTVTHTGGNTIEASNLRLLGSSASDDPANWEDASGFGSGSEISAGDSVDLGVANNDTIRVTWESDQGGDSAVLSVWEGPEA